ncbi:MAG: hypothetical protein UFG06_08395 [Lachnospiraceae bacterium]|nr:hypothetical protein [Lachnospiraceae bacterium]
MLDELIKTMDHGVSYGSGALKALQNDSLPEIDLLVREAIQNSSDASLKVNADRFDVNFTIGTFIPLKFNAELGSLKDILDEHYPKESADYLEIRDMRTTGLTGPVRLSELDREDHGNYFKLVFDTGKEQTASSSGEAGGSWGYGKSVYYRVGIGLVIFYSQIAINDSYEERMIVSLTEHETDSSSLLKEIVSDSVGRAWWGRKEEQNPKELLPITDGSEIESILDIFGVSRFKTGQTGTAIIIPYINRDRLLDGIFPDDCGISEDEKAMCSWKNSVEEYLELAVQKWYAPKIFNKHLAEYCEQKWLAVRINGNAIKDNTMRPFFQLVQELYISALACNANKIYKSDKFDCIECVSVPSARVEGQKTGHVAYARIKQTQLSANGSMIKPYTYLRLFSKSPLNDPIVMFARTPGLVLDYKIDGKWAKGLVKPEDDDEYIVAFYVPNCSVKIKNDKAAGEYAGKSFGEYLRKCEKSDHMDWDDKANLTIVSNLKAQVVAKINSGIKSEEQSPIEGTASKLSGKLGRKLLPKINFGKTSSGGSGGTGGSGGGGKADNLSIELIPAIRPDCVEVKFILTFKNLRKNVNLGLFIETETGVMDAEAWESNISNNFPVKIDRIESAHTCATNSKNTLPIINVCNSQNPCVRNDYTELKLLYTNSGSNVRGMSVSNDITNAVVFGTLLIKADDKKYVCTIKEVK